MDKNNDSKFKSLLGVFSFYTGWFFLIISGSLNLIIFLSWILKHDSISALNIPPIWAWGMIGLSLCLASNFLIKTKINFLICCSWILTTLVLADESKSLARGLKPTLTKAKDKTNSNLIRVITVNCNGRNLSIVREAMKFDPDIIFTQESPSPDALLNLLKEKKNNDYQIIGGWDCAIIAKGSLNQKKYPSILFNHTAGASLKLKNGSEIELLSLHLERAITRWDLWNPKCWKEHNLKNQDRKKQLKLILTELKSQSNNRPIIFGGDFNSSYQSNLYNAIPKIMGNFTNTFDKSGKGIGNTFTNYFPIIRIDHIYSSRHFSVVDSKSAKTQNSDHRMVISDLLLNQDDSINHLAN